MTTARIKLLSADIASKIAAGEVIERPASVLKELLENSIDAGATQIEVSIMRGGIQLIQVRDNGGGILKEDLALALQQHATSKISNAADLAIINTLGFRGEALASINSVAKLTVTSQTAQQPHAWSIQKETLNPAAHAVGTTVHMTDLFYNLPARRKFLRSERTEYQYLEETFRRIALSNFNVAFSLQNNGKLVKNLPHCKDTAAQARRLSSLCGKQALTATISIDAEQNGLRLWGWLGLPHLATSQDQQQYFFINQRVIRDRLINHAIRTAYQPYCGLGQTPFYCLYLELDPQALDVNVHPTKHEVRFRDVRVIHAFLNEIIATALDAAVNKEAVNEPPQSAFAANNYKSSMKLAAQSKSLEPQVLTILDNKIIVALQQEKLLLVDIVAARQALLMRALKHDAQTILLQNPLKISLSKNIEFNSDFSSWCLQQGFEFDSIGPQNLVLRSIPRALQREIIMPSLLLENLYLCWKNQEDSDAILAHLCKAIDYSAVYTAAQAQELLLKAEVLPPKGIWRELTADQALCL